MTERPRGYRIHPLRPARDDAEELRNLLECRRLLRASLADVELLIDDCRARIAAGGAVGPKGGDDARTRPTQYGNVDRNRRGVSRDPAYSQPHVGNG